MEELKGNRDGTIYKDGSSVFRPINEWSKSVHAYLNHLHSFGLEGIPWVLSVSESFERLTYIEGDTTDFPLKGNFTEEKALITAANFLRKLHDLSESFVANQNVREMKWMLPTFEPIEVICLGDFSPYNCAFKGDEVVGVFDFDTCHPAPRLWDLAYSVYCWSPFKSGAHESCVKTLEEQINRARVFCDAYGASSVDRKRLPDFIVKRLKALVDFMLKETSLGSVQFSENIADEHHLSYFEDIAYISENKDIIISGLLNTNNKW